VKTEDVNSTNPGQEHWKIVPEYAKYAGTRLLPEHDTFSPSGTGVNFRYSDAGETRPRRFTEDRSVIPRFSERSPVKACPGSGFQKNQLWRNTDRNFNSHYDEATGARRAQHNDFSRDKFFLCFPQSKKSGTGILSNFDKYNSHFDNQ